MQSQVYSIYLYYEDRQELILKATKGLHLRSVGKVKMKLQEGLTGLALQESRFIVKNMPAATLISNIFRVSAKESIIFSGCPHDPRPDKNRSYGYPKFPKELFF